MKIPLIVSVVLNYATLSSSSPWKFWVILPPLRMQNISKYREARLAILSCFIIGAVYVLF